MLNLDLQEMRMQIAQKLDLQDQMQEKQIVLMDLTNQIQATLTIANNLDLFIHDKRVKFTLFLKGLIFCF